MLVVCYLRKIASKSYPQQQTKIPRVLSFYSSLFLVTFMKFLAFKWRLCLYVHLMNMANNHEIYYRLFKIIVDNPRYNQRQMARKMGISLGKFNYCLTELVKKGFVKMNRFRSSHNKAAYMYFLTPPGLEEKARVTNRFLHRKMEEFEEIKKQIEELSGEVANMDLDINIIEESGKSS